LNTTRHMRIRMYGGAARSRITTGARAFTLVELLVVIAVMAMLIAILLPALGMSIGAARQFRCQVSLRSVGFDFGIFADETLHGDRGDDERELGSRFRLETFQESEYGISEFWRWGGENSHDLPDTAKNDPMRCASVGGEITVRRGTACRNGAISPPENVSFGFNGRLDRAPRGNSNRWTVVDLSSRILEESMVPLAWDVDGAMAKRNGVEPVFSAPALDATDGPFAGGRYWFPASRHNGGLNVLFMDQHVESTQTPLEERWDWSFLPTR
jgi:prepilin-type N-terminal cleavage/methylation domain-containing protein/prepilin-type processing-associated H-X9-DG protein